MYTFEQQVSVKIQLIVWRHKVWKICVYIYSTIFSIMSSQSSEEKNAQISAETLSDKTLSNFVQENVENMSWESV